MPTTEPLRSEPAPQLESTCPDRRSQVLRRRASAAKQTNIFQKEKKMALTPSQPNVTSICTIFNPFTFQFLITSHHRLIYGYTVPSSQEHFLHLCVSVLHSAYFKCQILQNTSLISQMEPSLQSPSCYHTLPYPVLICA